MTDQENEKTESAQFTPGPWLAKRIDYDLHGLDASYEVNAGRRTIVQTHMREIKSEAQWLAEDEANARLVSAAPELFEALVEALNDAPLTLGVKRKVRAALAKARGQ